MSEETEREALAGVVREAIEYHMNYDDGDWGFIADKILAAGFRRLSESGGVDLDAIRKRADAATGGPWRALGTGVAGGDHWYVCDDGQSIASVHANDGEDEDTRQPDAEFIAHARTDIPALIAEVERLRLSESEIREAQIDRDAALETAANYRAALVNNAHAKIAELSKWIDSSYPAEMIGTELHTRRRVDKLMEEAGEVGEAVGGWYGENPRKGVTHGLDDVLGELLDVAITALGAYESLTFNTGASGPALDAKIDKVLTRVGIEVSREN